MSILLEKEHTRSSVFVGAMSFAVKLVIDKVRKEKLILRTPFHMLCGDGLELMLLI